MFICRSLLSRLNALSCVSTSFSSILHVQTLVKGCKYRQLLPVTFHAPSYNNAIRTTHSGSSLIPRQQYRNIRRFMAEPCLQTMKIDSPEFKSLFTPELIKLQELFRKYKYEIRIAGGAVRDLLRGMVPHDVDFATTATPAEMKAMFEKEGIRMINMKGEKHGTITCRLNDKENFEVTTLRIDVVTDGRHAEVEFTKDWETDALRRDLTINAMFLDFNGTLYDYFNGASDLSERRVRFVGDPVSRIQEDYLRILRYFRFYGRIGAADNSHEDTTLVAIRTNMQGLAGISGERIWVELKNILQGRHASSLIRLMIELGVSPYIGFPDKTNIKEFEKVWINCQDLNPLPLTLVPALLESEEELRKFHDRVKLSRDELRLGMVILNHRHDDFGYNELLYAKGLLCDTVSKEASSKSRICELLKYRNMRETLKDFDEWNMPKFPVNGIMLLEKGVKKGPKLAKTLSALRQKWKESEFKSTTGELLEFVEELKETIE